MTVEVSYKSVGHVRTTSPAAARCGFLDSSTAILLNQDNATKTSGANYRKSTLRVDAEDAGFSVAAFCF